MSSLPMLAVCILFTYIAVSQAEQGFCSDYVSCMERLETKQRECLELEQNSKHRASDSCNRRKWEVKLELNGLHMRRAELAKDCVAKILNRQDTEVSLSESTLDTAMQSSCSSIHEKFVFAPSSTRKKRSATGKRSKRDAKKQTKAAECRTAAKAWHKQCSALARCCPLTEDCKIDTKEIMEQIYSERRKLKDLKDECEHL